MMVYMFCKIYLCYVLKSFEKFFVIGFYLGNVVCFILVGGGGLECHVLEEKILHNGGLGLTCFFINRKGVFRT